MSVYSHTHSSVFSCVHQSEFVCACVVVPLCECMSERFRYEEMNKRMNETSNSKNNNNHMKNGWLVGWFIQCVSVWFSLLLCMNLFVRTKTRCVLLASLTHHTAFTLKANALKYTLHSHSDIHSDNVKLKCLYMCRHLDTRGFVLNQSHIHTSRTYNLHIGKLSFI